MENIIAAIILILGICILSARTYKNISNKEDRESNLSWYSYLIIWASSVYLVILNYQILGVDKVVWLLMLSFLFPVGFNWCVGFVAKGLFSALDEEQLS